MFQTSALGFASFWETSWFFLPIAIVVLAVAHQDYKRLARQRSRNQSGHCALCDARLESFKVRQWRYWYLNTIFTFDICLACHHWRRKRRWIALAILVCLPAAVSLTVRMLSSEIFMRPPPVKVFSAIAASLPHFPV